MLDLAMPRECIVKQFKVISSLYLILAHFCEFSYCVRQSVCPLSCCIIDDLILTFSSSCVSGSSLKKKQATEILLLDTT